MEMLHSLAAWLFAIGCLVWALAFAVGGFNKLVRLLSEVSRAPLWSAAARAARAFASALEEALAYPPWFRVRIARVSRFARIAGDTIALLLWLIVGSFFLATCMVMVLREEHGLGLLALLLFMASLVVARACLASALRGGGPPAH